MLCEECGTEMVQSMDPIAETYKGERITVTGVSHLECPKCGNVSFDATELDEFSTALDDAYREKLGLLSPSEIRSIRKNLGLTQSEFESLIGVSTPTVSRWETGASVQMKAVDNLLRVLAEYPCACSFLEDRSEAAPAKTSVTKTLGCSSVHKASRWNTDNKAMSVTGR